MQLRRLTVFALAALALGACRDDDDHRDPPAIEDLRVVKVRGDQAAPVPPAVQTVVAVAGGPALQVGPGGYSPEPLVARVEVVAGRSGSLSGPSSASLVPEGTLVHWEIDPTAGRLFAMTTGTDDSAFVVNRWAPGTKAGTYQAAAGRLVGADIVIDATWELVVKPGTLAAVSSYASTPVVNIGDTLWLPDYVTHARDDYHNPIPVDELTDYASTVEWELTPFNAQATPIRGTGWTLVVPEEIASWPATNCVPGSVGGCNETTFIVWFSFDGGPFRTGLFFTVLK